MAHGKRYDKAREGVDRDKAYPLEEAVKMVKERAKAKFDETIEVAMNLGVDPRHADQMVRGIVNLPNGSGRSVRVAVFARGAKADEARAALLPDRLSSREVEVLRLVAQGHSNREIGERLFISSNTVANHVRSVLQKTGTANRAEATAYAARHGLLV